MERIVDGTYEAGLQLNIGNLADEIGVSLIPTREALRRLESEGLVEFVYHRGARVTELTFEAYQDIMQTQAVLEALAVSLSAPFLTPTDLELAHELNRQMDAAHAAGDFHGYNMGSLEFHGLLRSRCPNVHLRETLERGQLRVAAVRASVVGYRGAITQKLSTEHTDLLDLIAAGAPPREIEQFMRFHREGTFAHDTASWQERKEREENEARETAS